MVAEVHLIAGARPNFMKIAPLYHALKREAWCKPVIVHTGQHYDANMSGQFFDDLGLPEPHFSLGVGSGSHAEQTGGVMIAYERICEERSPKWVVVTGDVNSTLACALVAAKLCVPLAHLEAGLRSGDLTMPEEINRIVTDRLADLLWTPSSDGDENLRAEGVSDDRIERVGNIMIDSYELHRKRIEACQLPQKFGLDAKPYTVVTLHRPVNVDRRETLEGLLQQLVASARLMPLVFAVHPRTKARMEEYGLRGRLNGVSGLKIVDPLGYIEFMSLMTGAAAVITDSGGIQEETTYLGIPCITVRDTTERPITISQGTNRLVGSDQIYASLQEVVDRTWPIGRCPDLWDGHTAARVASSLRDRMERVQ